jgi:hypothetical protein
MIDDVIDAIKGHLNDYTSEYDSQFVDILKFLEKMRQSILQPIKRIEDGVTNKLRMLLDQLSQNIF